MSTKSLMRSMTVAVAFVMLVATAGCDQRGSTAGADRGSPTSEEPTGGTPGTVEDASPETTPQDLAPEQGMLPSRLTANGAAETQTGQYVDKDGYAADITFTVFRAVPLAPGDEEMLDLCPGVDGRTFTDVIRDGERIVDGGLAQAFTYSLTSPDPDFPFPWREYVSEASSFGPATAWMAFLGLNPVERPSWSCVADETESSVTWIGFASVLPRAGATPNNPDESLTRAPTSLEMIEPFQALSDSWTSLSIVESPEALLKGGWKLDHLIENELFDRLIAGESPTAVEPTGTSLAPCIAAYPGGERESVNSILGETITYDAEASRFAVCAGFGSSTQASTPSGGMQCAVIAAISAQVGAPGAHRNVSRACAALSVAESFETGRWAETGSGFVCGVLTDMFATGVGITAAGTSSFTGPAAVAVGVSTYKAIVTGGELACGAIGSAYDWGGQVQAQHEARLAADVVHHSRCLTESRLLGQLFWGTTDC